MRKDKRKSSKRKSVDTDQWTRKRSTSATETAELSEAPVDATKINEKSFNHHTSNDFSSDFEVSEDTTLNNFPTSEHQSFELPASVERKSDQNGTEEKNSDSEEDPEGALVITETEEQNSLSGQEGHISDADATESQLADKADDNTEETEQSQDIQSSNLTSEAAARFYSSLNQLTLQAFMNVKRETSRELPLAENCVQNILATLNGGYYGSSGELGQESARGASHNESAISSLGFSGARPTSMLRPPTELSPDTFAKQLRHNDSASMVVCRSNAAKSMIDAPDTPTSSGRGGSTGSGQGNGGSSGLHQFVTRYTIERPEDSAKGGIEICLESDDLSNPIVEVECGGNKGLLYVTKLCQGSKGQSILFNDEWLTPNEFQFISGRETAKDWKRSIRHCGKSLKTLMTKGILQVHPPACECEYCKGHGPATVEKVSKKRSVGSANDRPNSYPDAARSVGSTTSSSTEFSIPLSAGPGDSPSIALHKPGREGGLSSIISQLHNKKAISGSDITAGSGEESLNLSVRAPSGASVGAMNGRKRPRETGLKHFGTIREEGSHLPLKRRHSNEETQEPFPVPGGRPSSRQHRDAKNSPEPLCMSPDKDNQDKERQYSSSSSKGDKKSISDDYNGVCDLSRNGQNYGNQLTSGRKNHSNIPPSSSNNQYPEYSRGYRSNIPYNDYELIDAMKRAFANVYPRGGQTSPPHHSQRPSSSSSPHPSRGGFNNIDSASRHYDRESPQFHKEQPMVELTSSHRKMSNNQCYNQYDCNRHRLPYGSHNVGPPKAPITVLHHHSNRYENPLLPNSRQASSHPSHTHHYYPMPPPLSHGYNSDRRTPSKGSRRGQSCVLPPRFDRRSRLPKSMTRRHVPTESQRQFFSDGCHDRSQPMLDLQHHAIPMLALTHSKKKESTKANEKPPSKSKDFQCGDTGILDYRSPASTNEIGKLKIPRMAASDDEISRKGDIMRQLSSSAPPPRFSNGSSDNGYHGLDQENHITDRRKTKDSRDDVFQFSRARAKSASPNATRPHPYFSRVSTQRSSSSMDAPRPDSNASCIQDSPFDSVVTAQQNYEMLKWQEVTSAIEEMGEWSLDDVSEFLTTIGCGQYKEIFRDNCIDGDALPLLMEHHLVERMGLKLGHALKVIARIHRRIGNHCALVCDRLSMTRINQLSSNVFGKTISSSETPDMAPPEARLQNGNAHLEKDGSEDAREE